MRISVVALLLLLIPVSGRAQERRTALPATVRPEPAAPAVAELAPAGPTLLGRVLQVVGGAAAGAWVGYMASQVAVSDWEDGRADRGGWAAGGAAFGMALGLTLPASRTPRPVPAPRTRTRERDRLQQWEIRESEVDNLYDLIRTERPEWLRTRGTASMRETPRGRTTGRNPDDVVITDPGIETIRVYLDDTLLGGVDELRDLPPGPVGEIRFLDRAEATQRWGAGHLHGAIHVITAGGQ